MKTESPARAVITPRPRLPSGASGFSRLRKFFARTCAARLHL